MPWRKRGGTGVGAIGKMGEEEGKPRIPQGVTVGGPENPGVPARHLLNWKERKEKKLDIVREGKKREIRLKSRDFITAPTQRLSLLFWGRTTGGGGRKAK